MSDSVSLNFPLGDGAVTVAVDDLVIAGWTGRESAAVEAHIVELEASGGPRPSKKNRAANCRGFFGHSRLVRAPP